MVEDTFQKLLEEYNIEKNSNTMDLMNTTIEEMTPQQRLDLINKMLEDLKSYENYFKLEDIGKNIDRYLNGKISFNELNLDVIPIAKALNFPEEKMDEKQIYFEKELYYLVLHEFMLGNHITNNNNIAKIFTSVINKRVEKLKQSIVVPKEVMDIIERIDNDPNNAYNPQKYLNHDLFNALYLFENNYKLDESSKKLADLRIEKENLINNLNANEEAIKRLKKRRKIYTLVGVAVATILTGILAFGIKHNYDNDEYDSYTEGEEIALNTTVSVFTAMFIAMAENFLVYLWHDSNEYKEILERKEIERESLPKLEKLLLQIKELEERKIMNNEVNSIKDSSIVDKELSGYTTITR